MQTCAIRITKTYVQKKVRWIYIGVDIQITCTVKNVFVNILQICKITPIFHLK